MIARTEKWLLSRMNEHETGFLRNSRQIDTFGRANNDITEYVILFCIAKDWPNFSIVKRNDGFTKFYFYISHKMLVCKFYAHFFCFRFFCSKISFSAYIVWALTHSGTNKLNSLLAVLEQNAQKSDDSYFIGLVAGNF